MTWSDAEYRRSETDCEHILACLTTTA